MEFEAGRSQWVQTVEHGHSHRSAALGGVLVAHLSLLADPVRSGLRLQVVLWVPVRVEDDHGVGGRQVDSQAASTGRQQETEILGCRNIKRQFAVKNMPTNIQRWQTALIDGTTDR